MSERTNEPASSSGSSSSGSSSAGRLQRVAAGDEEASWLAHGALDEDGALDPEATAHLPHVVIVDADAAVRAALLRHLGPACTAHGVEPADAVRLLQELACVDIALVDCDPPPSQQAPIFRELARWPGAVCVLMSGNHQKVAQLRALGVFAPLVLDKPLQADALDAIRSAVLEIAETALG
jgi:CheY-like chemotaxis protein